MESRKTRSASKPTLTITPVPQKRMKTFSIPSIELAKLKASKPMLVIPQPVLQSHDCLDETIRMAQIESNAYIALGVKEEPLDEYSDYGLSCEQLDTSVAQAEYSEYPATNTQLGEPYVEIEGRRMTRSAIRRQMGSLETVQSEDANNNSSSSSTRPKKRPSKSSQKEKESLPEFRPIVLSVCSLAPGYTAEGTPLESGSSSSSSEVSPALNNNNRKSFEGNNNDEKDVIKRAEKPVEQEPVKLMEEDLISEQRTKILEKSPDARVSKKAKKVSATKPTSARMSKDPNKKKSEVIENPIDDTPSNSSECESEKLISPIKRKLRERKSVASSPIKESNERKSEEVGTQETADKEITDEEIEDEDDDDDDDADAKVHDPDSDNYEPETSSEEESEEEAEAEEEPSTTPKLWALKDEERTTLTCSVCQKKFSRVSILTAHKKKHFDPKVYNCTHCNKVFSSESSYKHHVAYSGLAPFKCDRCQKSYYTEQKAEAHRATCQGKSTERKYHCEDCGRSYVMLCSLRTHIRERHSDFKPVKNLRCELCDKRFRHKKYLELHMYSHSSEKKFECDICHRKYKSGDILRHHIRMVHKNLPRVQCEICHKEVSRVSLKAHLNRHREKEEEAEESARHLLNLSLSKDTNAPFCRVCSKYFENDKLLEMHACEGKDGSFACNHCSASFTAANELVKHTCGGIDNTKSRNTSKIYKCVFCLREYNCHTPWQYHVRHHTNDKPYPCTECNKSFRLKQGLKVHMRNHTGEKPFKCDQCPAAFKQKPFLLDHMNTHTGNKPYQCQQCLARFSVRSALSTHKRIHRREMKRLAENEDATS